MTSLIDAIQRHVPSDLYLMILTYADDKLDLFVDAIDDMNRGWNKPAGSRPYYERKRDALVVVIKAWHRYRLTHRRFCDDQKGCLNKVYGHAVRHQLIECYCTAEYLAHCTSDCKGLHSQSIQP